LRRHQQIVAIIGWSSRVRPTSLRIHRNINPTGIVPIGPLIDFTLPHDRGRFG
jgi:glutathionyl-hydroquinone reductase